jgi:hypothetical protein
MLARALSRRTSASGRFWDEYRAVHPRLTAIDSQVLIGGKRRVETERGLAENKRRRDAGIAGV